MDFICQVEEKKSEAEFGLETKTLVENTLFHIWFGNKNRKMVKRHDKG